MPSVNNLIDTIQNIYSKKNIQLHEPIFFGNEKKYLSKTIDDGFVSSVGQFVNDIEKWSENYLRVNKSIAVVNGTSALHICLKLAGVDVNSEVICPALTFVATGNSILYCNASPVFIDVDIDTLGLSPEAILNFLNEFAELRNDICYNKKTGKIIKACVVMHTFGYLSRIKKIKEICDSYKIVLIEDAAEAFGSYGYEKYAGNFGLINAFSFNGNKIVTSGGGGLIVTNNNDLGNSAYHITKTSKSPHKWEFYHDQIGFNYRMPNINAALLLAQFENLEQIINSKKKIYVTYKNELKNNFNLIDIPETTDKWNYWIFSIMADDKKHRDYILEQTNSSGISTRPIWNLLFDLPHFNEFYRDNQANSKYLFDRIINIPSSAKL